MATANQVREVHKLLDAWMRNKGLYADEVQMVRSLLPELPKQKTLEDITHDVCDAWIGSDGNEWPDDAYGVLESWLYGLYKQLRGLALAESAHPEFLETEADYQNAPAGTVAAKDGWLAWVKQKNGDWSCDGGSEEVSILAQTGKRHVLRWGWTNE